MALFVFVKDDEKNTNDENSYISDQNDDNGNISEEKLQVFSLLIDGPFTFSTDRRLIYKNRDDVLSGWLWLQMDCKFLQWDDYSPQDDYVANSVKLSTTGVFRWAPQGKKGPQR